MAKSMSTLATRFSTMPRSSFFIDSSIGTSISCLAPEFKYIDTTIENYDLIKIPRPVSSCICMMFVNGILIGKILLFLRFSS